MKTILLSCKWLFRLISGKWGDWKLCTKNVQGACFYNAKSVIRLSKDIVQVRTKVVYTDIGVEEVIVRTGMEFENLHHNLHNEEALYEINCKDKIFRTLSLTWYSMDGKVIQFADVPDAKWKFIPPDTALDSLWKIVCN